MAQINTNRFFLTILDETAWGDEGAGGNEELIPVLDGDYNIALEDPVREQQHVIGDQEAFYAVQDVRNLRGSFKVGLWPHLWKRLLDLALDRTSGEVASITAKPTYPGVESRLHAGLKADTLTIDGQQGGDLSMTLDFIGRHEDTASEEPYPGSFVIPDIPSLLFKNCRFILDLDVDGGGTIFQASGVQSFSITLNNNHKPGPATENRDELTEDGVVAFLTAGRVNGDFRCTADFDRIEYSTLQRSRLKARLKIVGAHPSYTASFVVDVAGAVKGSAVTVPLTTDPTGVISVGDMVYFDGKGGNLPSVGEVTAVTLTDITIAVLDEDVVSGDNVYLAGFELKTAPALVSATPINHPFDDFLTVEVQGQMFSGGEAPLTYKATDNALPTP
jgi:hypothetical protein